MARFRRVLTAVGLSAAFLVATVVLVGGLSLILSPWSEINCEHQDIDLDTGRARFTRMVLWLPIRSEIRHTPISRALEIINLASANGDWRRVNTFTPGSGVSPHYRFHGALSDAQQLEVLWTVFRFTPDAQKESATVVLRLWKESNRMSGAKGYIRALYGFTDEPVSPSDLAPLNPFP